MSATDSDVLRRLRVHCTLVPAKTRLGWQVASSTSLDVYLLYIVSHSSHLQQHHEVIGSPPNIAVPTHFAKVVLTAKPSSPSTPHIAEIATGAFVLPNAEIPDQTPLENFVVPGIVITSSLPTAAIQFTCVCCSRCCGTRSRSHLVLGRDQEGFETSMQVHEVRGHRTKV